MGWDVIAGLILTYGIPLAEKLWQKWAKGDPPTQVDFDELKVLGAQTMRTQLLLAFARNGVAADSAEAKALLELLK